MKVKTRGEGFSGEYSSRLLGPMKLSNSNIKGCECFGSTATLLWSHKKVKKEHLSTIAIGYLDSRKDSINKTKKE
jgi:hypothetical protein